MAINPETEFVGKINPSDAEYPYGKARDITTPGDGTGTNWKANYINDDFGWKQALLQKAGLTPSGSPDTALESQYLQAMDINHGLSVADYTALIALDPADLVDGQVVNITDAGIAGSGNIRKVVGHGFTSVRGVIVRIDDDTYWERNVARAINADWFNLLRDGSDESVLFQEAVNFAKSSTGILFVSQGPLRCSNINIEDLCIEGVGVGANDVPYDNNGTVFTITDTVNPAFIVSRGTVFKGCNFFYPNQDGSTVNPIVYPPLFKLNTASTVSNFTLDDCVLVNPYIAIDFTGTSSPVAHGRINLVNTQAYAILSFMKLDEVLDDIHLENFMATPGVYQDIALTGNQYLRQWTQANGTFATIEGNCDGLSITNGIIFGYAAGFSTSGDIDLVNFNQVSFDRVPVVWSKTGGEIRNMVWSNYDIFAVDPDTPSLNIAAFNFGGTGSKVEAVFGQGQIAQSQGAVMVINDDGNSNVRFGAESIVKNWASATGLSGNVSAMIVSNSNAKFRVGGTEAYTPYGSSTFVNGISFNEISVRSCDMDGLDQAIILASGSVATVTGNTTSNTGTASVVVGTVGRLVNTANNFDIP